MIKGLTRVEVIEGKIFHLVFSNKIDLGRVFIRFQEHYESPKFSGKSFTLSEFKKWYTEVNGYKTFTYYTDWTGYNFPDTNLKSFISSDFPDLTDNEKTFIGMFQHVQGKFYIIGTVEGDQEAFKHEMAHARFYLSEEYRAKIEEILSRYDINRIKDHLRHKGYGDNVLMDEIHAYMVDCPALLLKEDAEQFYAPMIDEIRKAFNDGLPKQIL